LVKIESMLSKLKEAENNPKVRRNVVEQGVYSSIQPMLTDEHKMKYKDICAEFEREEKEGKEKLINKEEISNEIV
jgi:hypothetical protein